MVGSEEAHCAGEAAKRIICLTTRFGTGGAELNALMLARAFRDHGHRVELWSLYRSGELAVADFPCRVMINSTPNSIRSFTRMVAEFRQNVKDFQPDVILGFQPLANIFGAAIMAGRGRFVASQRNPADSQRSTVALVEALLGSTGLYHRNIAVSRSVLDSYSRHPHSYRRRMQVIHNGLPLLEPITEDKDAARQRLGLPKDVHLVGTVGRLHKQKNQLFLMDVMKHLPNVHLLIAGDGPGEKLLRKAAETFSDRVHFIGRVNGAEIALAYRALDLFLFPSLYEGFGRSLIEAMSMRVPIIAHDLPITREVTAGHATLLPLVINTWVNGISQALANENYDLQEASARAQSFSLEAMVNSYLQVVIA